MHVNDQLSRAPGFRITKAQTPLIVELAKVEPAELTDASFAILPQLLTTAPFAHSPRPASRVTSSSHYCHRPCTHAPTVAALVPVRVTSPSPPLFVRFALK